MNRVLDLLRSAQGRFAPSGCGQADRYYWEEILVQITLAFVIILGYLITVSVTESSNLAARARLQEKRCNLMEKILGELGQTELGQARAEAVAAQEQVQLERLLRVWAERRVQRSLYRLLQQFDNAELIPLSSDLRCLPTSDSFQVLNREVGRVFLVGAQKVSTKEIQALLISILERAGFNLKTTALTPDAEILSATAAELYFDKNMPTRDNLKMLKLRMVADLEEERQQLCRLQYALVGKIAAARRDRLAVLPLPSNGEREVETQSDETDPGLRMLDQVLDDLKKEMQLLPEATDRIRQGGLAKSQSPPP